MNKQRPKIQICIGSSCYARGNERNLKLVEDFLIKRGLQDEVDVELEGSLCLGICTEGPNIVINGVCHHHVDSDVLVDLLNETFPRQE